MRPIYRGARRLVRPLLAGLMETSADRMWSFDIFFEKAKEIVSHDIVYIFSLCQCEMLHVFLKPNDKLVSLSWHLRCSVMVCSMSLYSAWTGYTMP
jgi:hypothetical protein